MPPTRMSRDRPSDARRRTGGRSTPPRRGPGPLCSRRRSRPRHRPADLGVDRRAGQAARGRPAEGPPGRRDQPHRRPPRRSPELRRWSLRQGRPRDPCLSVSRPRSTNHRRTPAAPSRSSRRSIRIRGRRVSSSRVLQDAQPSVTPYPRSVRRAGQCPINRDSPKNG